MREATIILPRDYHAAHTALKAGLLATFGGYTVHSADGQWRDPETGKVYDDFNLVYTVAAEDTSLNHIRLTTLAVKAGAMAKQLTVYIRQFDGEVSIVDVREDVEAV